jgi:DNA repair exonuclease SbcCD ATPase subunit/DNA repair exonuclease SbcCD nuclease subunit
MESSTIIFDTIYHISDIHIRLYHRLHEYKEVFEILYAFLESQKDQKKIGLIVITGDILHHKNELSPECILFTRDFLRRLAVIFPVAMIAGNHDALLNNQNRMDSLTAIVDSDASNLYYLKNSGFYRFGNVVFGVSSLFDDGFLPASDYVRSTDEDIRLIGLYHGGVGRFSTNKGFSMDGAPLSRFDGYDMTMLGDIHLYQYLDGEKKRVAYSGSLISQNYTETDPDHGVLVWDVKTGESRLHRIENPYAYCEAMLDSPFLEFRGKRYRDFSSLPIPSHARVSVILSRTKTAEDKERLRELAGAFPGATFVEKAVCLSSSYSERTIVNNTESSSSLDPMEILKAYVMTLSENWDREALFEDLIQFCVGPSEDGASWEILCVEFDHMFGYGGGNVIDMARLPLYETIGIFGENSAGKSSLIEVILFLLYGQITRYAHGVSVPREVIHFQEKKSRGMVRFRAHGIVYEIEKAMSLQKSGKIRVDEMLRRIGEDGTVEDLSEEHRKKTDKFVVSLIGTCQEFLFTTVFLQQNEESFRGMSPKDRKEFLNRILDLDRFEALHQEKSEVSKRVKRDLDAVEKELDRLAGEEALRTAVDADEKALHEMDAEEKESNQALLHLTDEKRALHDQKRPVHHRVVSDAVAERSRLESVCKEKQRQQGEARDALEQHRHQWKARETIVPPEELLKKEWKELEDLYRQRIGMPEKEVMMEKMGVTESNYKSRREEYMVGDGEEEIDEKPLQSEKERLLQRLEKEDPQLATLTTKKLTSLRDKKLTELSGDTNVDDLASIEKRLEELEETGWRQKKDRMEEKKRSLESASNQMTRMVERLCFESGCDACGKNKAVLGDSLSMQEQRRALEEENARLLAEIAPIEAETKVLDARWSDAKKTVALREQLAAMEIILSNRAIRTEMTELEARLRAVERRRSEREAWTRIDQYMETVQRTRFMNQHIEEEILKKKSKIQEVEEALSALRRFQDSELKVEKAVMAVEEAERERMLVLQSIENAEHNRGILMELDKKEVDERRIRDSMQRLHERRIQLSIHLQSILRDLETRTAKKKLFDRLQKESAHLQHLLHITGRDGFPMFLLDRFLPFVQEKLNEIVGPFLKDRSLVLCSEKNIQLYMRSQDSNTVYMGGMEGFIVDAALKIVFTRISRRPRCNLFIIDEGISALDKKNMENLDQFFQFLEQFFPRVFVISHLREAQEFVRKSIMVVKDPGTMKSRLVY